MKASVDQFDLSYDDSYTPLFKIPLSDLVSNDKDLVAGNNTSLAIDEASIGVFSSDSSKMTISVIEEDGVKKVSVVPLDTNGNGTHTLDQQNLLTPLVQKMVKQPLRGGQL